MEKIITPRGTFRVEEFANYSHKKLDAITKEGYGYWFSNINLDQNYIDLIYIKQGTVPATYKVLRQVLEEE